MDARSTLLETQVRGPVLVMRMRREDKRNAIDRDLALQLEDALDLLEEDDRLRVGVLTGTPKVFSAGTDVMDPRDKHTVRGGAYGVVRRARRKPLIAAVEGAALGGGFEIVMSCDLVVAATDATFGLPEGRLGLVATSGALFRAARVLPRTLATELLLTGTRMTAERAHHFGLVNRCVPPGTAEDAAVQLAGEVCNSSPTSIRATLEALQALDAAADGLGWLVTTAARERVLASPDAAEGVQAFRERRAPSWAHQPRGGAHE